MFTDTRFNELKGQIDAAFGAEPVYSGNDRSQIYKAFFKCIIIEDGALVRTAIDLASENCPGSGLSQVYPMLHLPKDTSEQGNWHRDHNSHKRRVFWVPISEYDYAPLSIVPNSDGILSMPLSMLGSRGFPLKAIERDLIVTPNTFYSWSSRFVHRGNFNTSDRIGSAFVIFFDQGKSSTDSVLAPISLDAVRDIGHTLRGSIEFNTEGNIASVDPAALSNLPTRIANQIDSFYKIRTRRSLFDFVRSTQNHPR